MICSDISHLFPAVYGEEFRRLLTRLLKVFFELGQSTAGHPSLNFGFGVVSRLRSAEITYFIEFPLTVAALMEEVIASQVLTCLPVSIVINEEGFRLHSANEIPAIAGFQP